ncbi:MAG TPA: carboxymuconolactone decarboxylase family protein [Pyrinomonadaceae bacterium]|jgi:alkylhydroperoxidase family enzyme
MDIGSAVGRQKDVVTDEELREVPNWQHSKILGERERAAIEYAEEMSKTPVRVSDELFERLKKHFSDEQIVELSASIAYENYRARFNHALDIKSDNLYR